MPTAGQLGKESLPARREADHHCPSIAIERFALHPTLCFQPRDRLRHGRHPDALSLGEFSNAVGSTLIQPPQHSALGRREKHRHVSPQEIAELEKPGQKLTGELGHFIARFGGHVS